MLEKYGNSKLISSGLYGQVYRAVSLSEGGAVILKRAKSTPPTEEEKAAIDHEWEMMQQLQKSPSVPKPLAREVDDGSPVIVMEYLPYPTVASLLSKKKRFELEPFLHLAIAMTNALENIHRFDVIHKDFNSFNLFYDEEKRECKVVDFSLSIAIDHQKIIPVDARFLEGTLPYLSPEQSGRMNRGIDYRTDYYSLGITLYQALTGRFPFYSKEPLEMVHFHMAMRPPSPSAIDGSIPEVLSSMILKLIMKEPEERYQSIAGIRGDLENCLEGLSKGLIVPFPLASKDTHERFELPEKIYGRDEEVRRLLSIYEEVYRGGSKLLLVGGYSGIGKTSLVLEMYKQITQYEGKIVTGKFEQLKQSVPYIAISQLLNDLAEKLLYLPDQEFTSLKSRLLKVLGPNGQLIVDIAPAMEKILGKQLPLPQLGMVETQNRFIFTFRSFIESLPSRDRPLVFFIDDLQWADAPSVKLIEMIVEEKFPYLLVVCGYRDNEVDDSHPFSLMVRSLEKKGVEVPLLKVTPLKEGDITEYIADALYKKPKDVLPLAKISTEKSGGNPFFLIKLLENFYENDWIRYDWDSALWVYDVEKIENASIADNVADLISKKIALQREELVEILSTAACIGSKFSLELLQLLCSKEREQLRSELKELLKLNFIVCEERDYYRASSFRFSHDRVQEAAHSLLSVDQQVALHLAIGKNLEKKAAAKKSDGLFFAIADHINYALADGKTLSATDDSEREHFAELNLKAMKSAKKSSAHETALTYGKKCLEWLKGGDWKKNYRFLIDLYRDMMESAYVAEKFEEMERYIAIILEKGRDGVDRCPAYNTKGLYQLANLECDEMIETLLTGLKDLGFSFPKHSSQLQLLFTFIVIYSKLVKNGFSLEKVEKLPINEDRADDCFYWLTGNLFLGVYIAGNQNLVGLLLFKAAEILVEKGVNRHVSFLFSYFSFINAVIGTIAMGKRVAVIAKYLAAKSPLPELIHLTEVMNTVLLEQWINRYDSLPKKLIEVYPPLITAGNLQFSSISLGWAMLMKFFASAPLYEVAADYQSQKKAIERLRFLHISFHTEIVYLKVLELMDERPLPRAEYPYEKMDTSEKGIYWAHETTAAYVLGDQKRALDAIERCQEHINGIVGITDGIYFEFFEALTLAKAFGEEPSPFRRLAMMAKMRNRLFWFKKYAKYQGENFLSKALLIDAEWARITKRGRRAARLYDEALFAARKNGFFHEVAIGSELAARFCLEKGNKNRAIAYLKEAIAYFEAWGSYRKAKILKEEFSELLQQGKEGKVEKKEEKVLQTATMKIGAENLNIGSIQKASESIASTLLMEELLDKLMAIVMEQAGAEKGLLLIENEGEYFIQAESLKGLSGVKLLQNRRATKEELPEVILQQTVRNFEMMIAGEATEHPTFKKDTYIQKNGVRSLLAMPLVNKERVTAILYLENNLTKNAFTEERYTLLIFLSSQLAMAIDNAKLYQGSADLNEELNALNKSYERFVPKDFIRLIGKKRVTELLPGDNVERVMTVLFMDIRGFTSLSEEMSPQENFTFINEFISYMEPIIDLYGGFIDKYIGDAIMALFPGSPDDALKSAVEMLRSLEKYNQLRKKRGDKPINIGIGINSGKLILGTVGNEKRMEGTVISDVVNVASRIEHLTKEYNAPILLTENSLKMMQHPELFGLLSVGQTPIRGKKQQMLLYTLKQEKEEEIEAPS